MSTLARIVSWAVIAFGLYVCIMPMIGCSGGTVVGTIPYVDPNAGVITWDDHLGDALCALGWCNANIVAHQSTETAPAEAVLVGTMRSGESEFSLAAAMRGDGSSVWGDCDPTEEVHCWAIIVDGRYEVRCDFGACGWGIGDD